MQSKSFPFGYRIVGDPTNDRRLTDAAKAFHAHAACLPQAAVGTECYLSAFCFTDDFRDYLEAKGTTKGFNGPCWTPWIHWDIDRAGNLEAARMDAVKLVNGLIHDYGIDPDHLLVFFSGSKGFHIGIPISLIPSAEPSGTFNKVVRSFCETWADRYGVVIDASIYDRVRAFRAPNSKHPKTGLHKRRVSVEQLNALPASALAELAREPEPFQIPDPAGPVPGSIRDPNADWQEAIQQVKAQTEADAHRQSAKPLEGATLNRATLDFIREGAGTGDRHRLLFSAAANLSEFGCPARLAHALLTESARDCGLRPSDIRRQIDCGLTKGGCP